MGHNKNLQRNIIQRVNVGDLLTRAASRSPAQVGIACGTSALSWRDANAWTNRVAHGLVARGYGHGDALVLFARNCTEFLVTYFACAKIGVVCVPINLLWQRGEIGYVLGHARARGAVCNADFTQTLLAACHGTGVSEIFVIGAGAPGARAADAPVLHSFESLGAGQPEGEPEHHVEDRDAVQFLYTSGTTSAPKGVMGSHLGVYLNSLTCAIEYQLTRVDRFGICLPLFHTAALNALATPAVAVAASVDLLDGFDAALMLDRIESSRISIMLGVPMMYRALVAEQRRKPRDISSLRLAIYAMAPMPDHELREGMEVLGCGFSLVFGQTEMSPLTTYFAPEDQLQFAGSVGRPVTNTQVAIMDEEGRLLPTGEAGEVVYRGPQVLNGYLYNEAATEEVFRHGWFHSGDAGHFDEHGVLWFEDRFKDVIKTGGENVSSIEVEKALYGAEPGLAEVAVVGLPHAHWGEAITAVAIPREGAELDPAATLAKLRSQLSAFKCPKALIVAQALPKTATGKIQKNKLRQLYAGFYSESAA